MKMRWAIVCGLTFMCLRAVADVKGEPGDWVYYGHDLTNSKYSPLDQIDASNFKNLKIAWRWRSIEEKVSKENRAVVPSQFKPTPLVVKGVMYLPTSVNQIVALDPGTGELVWEFDPQSYKAGRPTNVGWQHRGISYWTDGKDERILVASQDRKLWALDAKTGQPCKDFNDGTPVDLEATMSGAPSSKRMVTHTSPVAICKNTIIVGSIVFDGPTMKEMPAGHVRGFDVRTGAMKWIFHTVPQEGEFGNDTWENDSWKYSGNTNVWSMMSVDEQLGYVYLPVSTPTNDMYGGHRLGNNLFGESLVCLNAETGERVWHFQAVHHGLWDYDFPTAPILADVTINGKPRKIVAQVSKQANCYVFDRVTGEPIWPIEEKPVPQSTVPGERSSLTQPFPTKPAAFDRQGFAEADVIDFTPALKAAALKAIDGYQTGPLFTPPNEKKGTLGLPSAGGGANWPGAALDPETGILYVPSGTTLGHWKAVEPDHNRSNLNYVSNFMTGGGPMAPELQGLPFTKPPYSRVTAIDLNTGEHLWMTPNGDGPINHPLLKDLHLKALGQLSSGIGGGGPLLTKTLFFVTRQAAPIGTEADMTPHISVFDKKNGKMLGTIPLPGDPYGNPMTYSHKGKQYIAVGIGGGGFIGGPGKYPAEVVTLALP